MSPYCGNIKGNDSYFIKEGISKNSINRNTQLSFLQWCSAMATLNAHPRTPCEPLEPLLGGILDKWSLLQG